MRCLRFLWRQWRGESGADDEIARLKRRLRHAADLNVIAAADAHRRNFDRAEATLRTARHLEELVASMTRGGEP